MLIRFVTVSLVHTYISSKTVLNAKHLSLFFRGHSLHSLVLIFTCARHWQIKVIKEVHIYILIPLLRPSIEEKRPPLPQSQLVNAFF